MLTSKAGLVEENHELYRGYPAKSHKKNNKNNSTTAQLHAHPVPSNPPNTNPPIIPFGSPGVPGYHTYLPAQPAEIGALAAKNPKNAKRPPLFEEITIRGVTWPHRMWVAPMCMCM